MNIELKDEEVRYVLNALAKCPWGEVDNLIRSIAGQAQAAQQSAPPPGPIKRDIDEIPAVGGTD